MVASDVAAADALVKSLLDWEDVSEGTPRCRIAREMAVTIAAKRGRVDALEAFFAAGFSFDHTTALDDTIGHMAATSGHGDVLRFLGTAGCCDLSARNYFKETPAHGAVIRGHFDCLVALTAAGADVDAEDVVGVRPLLLACASGRDDLVRILLDAGADVSAASFTRETPVYAAAKAGHASIVETLAAAGADIDAWGPWGYSPLHAAAQLGHYIAVNFLVLSGATVDCADLNANTPTHLAAMEDRVSVLGVLARAGADLEAENMYSERPVHLAAKRGNVGALRVLAAAGADLESRCRRGDRPIHMAATKSDRLEALVFLLESGCDARATTRGNLTPLHFATCNANLEAVEALLSATPRCGDMLGLGSYPCPDEDLRSRSRTFPVNVRGIERLAEGYGNPCHREGLQFLSGLVAYVAINDVAAIAPVITFSRRVARMALRYLSLRIPTRFADPGAERYLEAVARAGSLRALVTEERYSLAVARELYIRRLAPRSVSTGYSLRPRSRLRASENACSVLMDRVFRLPRGAGDLVLAFYTDLVF